MNGKVLLADVGLLQTSSANIKRDQPVGSMTKLQAMIALSAVQSST